MKTVNQQQRISYLKIMLVSLFFSCALNSTAQKISKAVEIASDVTGSGLGANINIGTTLGMGNSVLNFGANFQRKKFNLSGIQITYRYTVGRSDNEKTELFFLGNMTLHTAATISNNSIKIEEKCRPEVSNDYNALTLKVIESYVGFGLKHNFTRKISTIGSIGVGGYETLNNDYDRKMYRPKSGLSLRFRIGIAYNFTKNNHLK